MACHNFSNINLKSGTVFNKHYSGIYSKKEKLITANKQKRQNYYIREGAFAYLQNVTCKHRRNAQQEMSNKKLNKPFRTNQNSKIRKDFYKRLLYIGICIIPIIIFADNKDEFRLVPLPFFLFGMYQLILIVGQSQFIVDDFFPPKKNFESTTEPFNKFINYFAMTLFFCSLVFLIFEIGIIDNTINGTTLFWNSALIGFGIATLITIILKLTKPSVYHESSRRYTVHFGLFIGLFLLIPAMTSFINHNYAENTENCKAYEIVRKSTGGKRNKSSWLFLKLENNLEERFDVNRTFYDKVNEGEQIQLCTRKGKLGYDFVEEFKTIN